MDLDDPVQFVKGVGPRRAELLEKSGLCTVEDLLYHLPFRYEDRRRIVSVDAAVAGQDATFVGRITGLHEIPMRRRGGRAMLEASLAADGARLGLVWFHQASYFKKKIQSAQTWLVHGRVEASRRGGLQIVHPEIEPVEEEDQRSSDLARVVPVYSKPTDFPLSAMRTVVERAVDGALDEAVSIVPAAVREKLALAPLREHALRYVHAPPTDADVDALAEFATPAHRSLIFEELFALQIGISLRRSRRQAESGLAMAEGGDRVEAFLAGLPFEPTGAQQRVIAEIAADMARSVPMNRLVHGDVGSGKTVVAFAAALHAISSGYQVAVMAPTELLAEQHFATMRPWAEAHGVSLELLSGALRAAEQRRVRRDVLGGLVELVVGTHALVQEATEFARLGLAIVDEQHRFGVMQRATLRGGSADTLLLSATPIPRTLALTLYGDLDVSFFDEMPPGRQAGGPHECFVDRAESRSVSTSAWRRRWTKGRSATSSIRWSRSPRRSDLADATSMAQELQTGPFRNFRVGLIHGRMKPDEKDAVMRRFKDGETRRCLVATTVIEVGIDVPNASIMVIEHAERFGLAQLHQLRGRVGPRRRRGVLLSGGRRGPEHRFDGAAARHGADQRWLQGRRGRPASARPGRVPRHPPIGRARVPRRQSSSRCRAAQSRARKEAAAWLDHDPATQLCPSRPSSSASSNGAGARSSASLKSAKRHPLLAPVGPHSRIRTVGSRAVSFAKSSF